MVADCILEMLAQFIKSALIGMAVMVAIFGAVIIAILIRMDTKNKK